MNAPVRPNAPKPLADAPQQLVDAVPEFIRTNGRDPVTSRLIVPGLEYQLSLDGRPKRIPIGRNTGAPDFGGEWITQEQLLKRIGLIGVTGWNWKAFETQFAIFDYDATDHAAGHIEEVLNLVINAARQLGWVWVRRSKGGRGIHLVVVLSRPMPAQTGTAHQQNAEAIVARMTEEVGFDFAKYLDCGGVVGYIWAPEVADNAFEVLVEPTCKTPDIELPVTSRPHPPCCSARLPMELSEQHRADIEAMRSAGFIADFAGGRLRCHSKGFEVLYQERGRPGNYRSRSAARNPSKENAFAYPTEDGGWIVSRFGTKPNVEDDCWYANAAGFATARVRPPATLLMSIYKSFCETTNGENHVES